ncbi:MAG: hypothetical protein GWN84_20895 [Gammaproteobacteria bacterium]|nr:hypothetical protein [Gammaproteobacteria bacterium]NIR85219.1 hypothetical protein [Gammaproteobacteria bacterium]NIU06269.1 hypothetical protein [Gammaproteobacteria bacterium]NIX87542.1 hypothetical protein [Gammaproteobacteria bacterium]
MAEGADRLFAWPEAVWVEEGPGLAGYAPEYAVDEETQTQFVEWGEGGRRRVIEVDQVLESTPETFAFVDRSGERWRFRELTLERYRQHVRPQTMLQPDFDSREAMLEAMRAEW